MRVYSVTHMRVALCKCVLFLYRTIASLPPLHAGIYKCVCVILPVGNNWFR